MSPPLLSVGAVIRDLLRPWREAATWWSLTHVLLDVLVGSLTFSAIVALLAVRRRWLQAGAFPGAGGTVADLGGLPDHHTHAVVDEDAPANDGAGMDLDAGDKPADLGNQTGQHEEPPTPQCMGNVINGNRM